MLKRKKEIIALAAISLILASTPITNTFANELVQTSISNQQSQTKLKVKEIIGIDRYDTAIKISQEGFKEMRSSVILVNATGLSDALCVAPLANAYDCPILLINKDNIPQKVYEEINRLGAQDITLIGGEGVISKKVEQELQKKGYFTGRIGGESRYETSLNIAKELNEINPITEVAIVNGVKGLADATSIAAPSARDNRAILYTNGNDINEISKFLTPGIKKAYIVGKEAAVSLNVENQLKSKGLEVKRLGGDNRNDTNAKVLNEFYNGNKLNYIYVAKDGSIKESDLVDALAAGPLAGKNESPIIITSYREDISKSTLSNTQIEFVKNNKPTELTKVGGGSNNQPFFELVKIIDSNIK